MDSGPIYPSVGTGQLLRFRMIFVEGGGVERNLAGVRMGGYVEYS